MIIDVHAHVIVPELLRDELLRGEPWRPRVWWQNGIQSVELGGKTIRSAVRELVDAESILAEQDAVGVDRVLVSPWAATLDAELPIAQAECVAGVQNDGLAALVAAHPDRIVALGALPLHDPAVAARELRELMRRPGFAGVEIPARAGGRWLGDDGLRPLWVAAEETGALVFVHPTTHGLGIQALDDYYLWNTVGNPMETAIAAAHMTCAGVLENHPGLKVLLAHGGGVLLALRGRLRHAWSFQPQVRSRMGASPDESLACFLYDTVVHDVDLLRALVGCVGVDHVLLGSDYPFDMGDQHAAQLVRAVGLARGDEERILGATAASLLPKIDRRA
ncbi:MAG: amidohydrolase family protein [Solirubrobacteraceae bacterium]